MLSWMVPEALWKYAGFGCRGPFIVRRCRAEPITAQIYQTVVSHPKPTREREKAENMWVEQKDE